jgi:hypothetical protein
MIEKDSIAFASTINGASVASGRNAVLAQLKSFITIKEMAMNKLKYIHQGEILLEEFLLPMEISQTLLTRAIGVPPRRINEIVLGKLGIFG